MVWTDEGRDRNRRILKSLLSSLTFTLLLSAGRSGLSGGDDLNPGAQSPDAKGYVSPFLCPVGIVNSIVLCFIQRDVANSTADRSSRGGRSFESSSPGFEGL